MRAIVFGVQPGRFDFDESLMDQQVKFHRAQHHVSRECRWHAQLAQFPTSSKLQRQGPPARRRLACSRYKISGTPTKLMPLLQKTTLASWLARHTCQMRPTSPVHAAPTRLPNANPPQGFQLPLHGSPSASWRFVRIHTVPAAGNSSNDLCKPPRWQPSLLHSNRGQVGCLARQADSACNHQRPTPNEVDMSMATDRHPHAELAIHTVRVRWAMHASCT